MFSGGASEGGGDGGGEGPLRHAGGEVLACHRARAMHAATLERGAQCCTASDGGGGTRRGARSNAAPDDTAIRADAARFAGDSGGPRPANALDARGDAGALPEGAGAGDAARRRLWRRVGRVEGRRVPYRNGPGEELWARLCARLAGAWARGVGGDRGECGGDAGDGRRDPDAGRAVAGALPRDQRRPPAVASISGTAADCAARHGGADRIAASLDECGRCAVGAVGVRREDRGAGTEGHGGPGEPDDAAGPRAE